MSSLSVSRVYEQQVTQKERPGKEINHWFPCHILELPVSPDAKVASQGRASNGSRGSCALTDSKKLFGKDHNGQVIRLPRIIAIYDVNRKVTEELRFKSDQLKFQAEGHAEVKSMRRTWQHSF